MARQSNYISGSHETLSTYSKDLHFFEPVKLLNYFHFQPPCMEIIVQL